jgi:Skp family chaperone for outer membrane proteins
MKAKILTLVAASAAAIFVQAAEAQSLPPAVIAVIDIQTLQRDSLAAKDIVVQLEKYRSSFQAEITKEEDALRNQEQELGRQRTILTPDAFAERQRQFQQKVADVQRKVQERTRQLERSHAQARNDLGRAIQQIVLQMSQTRQFNMALDKAFVPFTHSGLDITDIVLDELNRKQPKVAVPAPDKS